MVYIFILWHHPGSTVVVSKAELDLLATETMMLKEFLPKVLNPDYLSTFSQLSHVEQGELSWIPIDGGEVG